MARWRRLIVLSSASTGLVGHAHYISEVDFREVRYEAYSPAVDEAESVSLLQTLTVLKHQNRSSGDVASYASGHAVELGYTPEDANETGPLLDGAVTSALGRIPHAVSASGRAVAAMRSASSSRASAATDQNPLQGIIGSIGDIAGAIGGAISSAASQAADAITSSALQASGMTVLPDGAPLQLGSNSKLRIDIILIVIILSVFCCSVFGYVFDRSECLGPFGKGRPTMMKIAMLLSSYVVLIPGLFCTLWSFNMAVTVLGSRLVVVTTGHGGYGAHTDSQVELMRYLFGTGGYLGGTLLILYAIVVPVLKLGLLAVGEMFRFSKDHGRRSLARGSIRVVQVVSKWACPDMFAYILLLVLVRDLNAPPTVESKAQLDIGFACFSVFCVISTISAVLIQLPEELEPLQFSSSVRVPMSRSKTLICGLGAVVLFAGFLGCFAAGMSRPCMSLHLTPSAFLNQVNLPSGLMTLLGPKINNIANNIASQVSAEVHLSDAVWKLLVYTGWGDLNSLLALFMLLGCAILLPLVDALVTAYMAVSALMRGGGGGKPVAEISTWWSRHGVATWVGHLAMLDVCVMGVIIVKFSAAIYQEQGVAFEFESGIWCLLVAEVSRHLLHGVAVICGAWLEPEKDVSRGASNEAQPGQA